MFYQWRKFVSSCGLQGIWFIKLWSIVKWLRTLVVAFFYILVFLILFELSGFEYTVKFAFVAFSLISIRAYYTLMMFRVQSAYENYDGCVESQMSD